MSNQLAQRLIDSISELRHVVVAFSGGVDSSVVAAAAVRADLDSLVAMTAKSASVSDWQLSLSKTVAKEIGIKHTVFETGEMQREEYTRNDGRRCFFCKQTLYSALSEIADRSAEATVLSGTNADDLGDYRPGIDAGRQASVVTPLADLGIGKQAVREIAKSFGLSNADLPASPCLASRIAYGVSVTSERLARIEKAESWLRTQGFSDFRVRLHEGELARVELLPQEMVRMTGELAGALTTELKSLGFRFVTLDLNGLQSGSLNQSLVSIGSSVQR